MANFAQIDEYNIVRDVIVISNTDCDDLPFPESEPIGQAYIASLGLAGQWLQTSYIGAYRGYYAALGYTWNGTDFVPPTAVTS